MCVSSSTRKYSRTIVARSATAGTRGPRAVMPHAPSKDAWTDVPASGAFDRICTWSLSRSSSVSPKPPPGRSDGVPRPRPKSMTEMVSVRSCSVALV